MVSGNILSSAHCGIGYEVLRDTNQQRGRQTRSNRSQISQNRMMNLTQMLETLKTQSCIDIVGKRCKVCYINFLLNISHSNINKSVITIRRGHFMSSVFVNPGIYSCAVDAFLEISKHSICFPHIYQVHVLGMILQTSFSMFVHIISVREKRVHY